MLLWNLYFVSDSKKNTKIIKYCIGKVYMYIFSVIMSSDRKNTPKVQLTSPGRRCSFMVVLDFHLLCYHKLSIAPVLKLLLEGSDGCDIFIFFIYLFIFFPTEMHISYEVSLCDEAACTKQLICVTKTCLCAELL